MNMLTRFLLSFLFIALLVFHSAEVVAQQRTEMKAADTSSPRATLRSFIDACNDVAELVDETGDLNRNSADYGRIANRVVDCLDMSETSQFARFQRAGEVAVCIKEILDRVEIPDWDQIPDTAAIEAAGGFEKLSTWRIPGTRITIARVSEGPQKHEYLFSPGTIGRAVDYFENVRDQPYRVDGDGPAVSGGLYDDFLPAQQRTEMKAADTSSPRATLKSFIDACNEMSQLVDETGYLDRNSADHGRIANRVVDCLDMSETPQFARFQRAGEVAVCIKEILDREEIPNWDQIPDTVEIEAAGGFEKLSTWRIPGTRITIARVSEGPQKHEYLFSPGTVSRAVDYYYSVRDQPYRTDGPAVTEGLYDDFLSAPGHPFVAKIIQPLPTSFRRARIFGMAAWKWPGVLLAIVVAVALFWTSYRRQWKLTEPAQEKGIFWYWLTLAFPIFALLVPLGFHVVIEDFLTVRGNPLYLLSFCAKLAALSAVFVLVFSIVNRIAETIIASPRINPQGLNAQLIRIVSKLTSLVASLVLFVVGGQYLGIPVGTLLASAGIFGAAIALASQDVLRSLLGTVTLLGDKPFRVGDRIKFQEYEGWIEDIGLRSTRLRLLEGHVVRLPNDQLANSDVENISNRKHIQRKATIHIPLDTACEKVEQAVSIIREKLENHSGMSPDRPPCVILEEFGSHSFCIRFWYWYSPPDLWDFLEFNSKLNFEIFREFELNGIQYSLPFRHTFWKHDDQQGPLDVRLSQNQDEGERT